MVSALVPLALSFALTSAPAELPPQLERARARLRADIENGMRRHLSARGLPGGRSVVPLARVRPGRSVELRSRPGGEPIARVGDSTEFGSRRVLPVVKRRGRWMGVPATEASNRLAWVDGRTRAVEKDRTRTWLKADLSRRTLELRRGTRTVRRMKVSVGGPGSPTPVGTFAVTDKMRGERFSPYYGCCILALSGRQDDPPQGWSGGNRLAIHGTNAPGTVGKPASAGCLRGQADDLRVLMRRVPVGAPVKIVR